MGILVEFNPDLALRHMSEFREGQRKEAECIPESVEAGKQYPFLKKGQRNYWLLGELPLLETKGNQELSRPRASIRIIEVVHTLENGEVWTKGVYEVTEVFIDGAVHFESYKKLGIGD